MARTSCIQHKSKSPIVILHQDYLDICDNNKPAAIILKDLEYWTDVKLASQKQAEIENKIRAKEGQPPIPADMWIYKTHQDFIEDSLDLLKLYEVKEGLKLLLDKGFISKRNNPAYQWDRTLQYKLEIDRVQSAINNHSIGYRQPMDSQPVTNQLGTDDPSCITEITTEVTTDINTPPSKNEKKQPLDPLTHALQAKANGVSESTASNPSDAWLEYGKKKEELFHALTNTPLDLGTKELLTQVQIESEEQLSQWRMAILAGKDYWSGNGKCPIHRMIEIYTVAGGDWNKFVAIKWPKDSNGNTLSVESKQEELPPTLPEWLASGHKTEDYWMFKT